MQYPILIGIFTTLLSHDKITAAELAQKYEVSTRTVMRYIDVLDCGGVPISSQKGKYGGIKISDNYRLNSQYFSEEEYCRLIPALKSYDLQDKTTQSIIDKLTILSKNLRKNYILNSAQLVVDTPMTQALQDKFALAQKAIVSNHICSITYHDGKGEITTREIEPYSLLLKDGLWYIYAYCLVRKDFRFFKITRVATITQLDKSFKPRHFDTDYAKDLVIPSQTPYIDFSFILNKHVLTEVEEWLGVNCVTEEKGKFVANAKLPFDNLLVSRLLSFGKDIVVTKPDYLVAKLRKILASTLHNYAE